MVCYSHACHDLHNFKHAQPDSLPGNQETPQAVQTLRQAPHSVYFMSLLDWCSVSNAADLVRLIVVATFAYSCVTGLQSDT